MDSTEIPLVRELGVRVYTMSEIDRRGASTCFREAVYHVGQNTAGIHLSFDLDGIDPKMLLVLEPCPWWTFSTRGTPHLRIDPIKAKRLLAWRWWNSTPFGYIKSHGRTSCVVDSIHIWKEDSKIGLRLALLRGILF